MPWFHASPMGVRQIVATGEHGESAAALRSVRRTHITRDNLRRAIVRVISATRSVLGDVICLPRPSADGEAGRNARVT